MSLGIEVTTAWLKHMGSAVKSVAEILEPSPDAPRMTPAKFAWEHARGKSAPPICSGNLISEPDDQAITTLTEAVSGKLDKNYGDCQRIVLVVEWEYFATDEEVVDKAIKHFGNAPLDNCPFEEVWILASLGSQLGREVIFRVHPAPEGPFMGPEMKPPDVL